VGNKTIDIPLDVGDTVMIRKYAVNPGFWDTQYQMYKLAELGELHKIAHVRNPDRLLLEGSQWVWRRKDLVLLVKRKGSFRDPNRAFMAAKGLGKR